VAAAVLAALAYPLWSIGVTIIGAVLGFLMLSAVGAALEVSQGVIVLCGVAGAIILGVLFYRLRDLLVMVTTALSGALEVVLGLGWLVPALVLRGGILGRLLVAAIVVLGAVGFAVQYGMFKERRTYSTAPLS